MTDQEINIAIAEALGWDCDPIEAHGWGSRGQWVKHSARTNDRLVSKRSIPNYCADLNAMHEAEKLFYGDANSLVGAERMSSYSHFVCKFQYPLHSTARQRAEAFLRTLGKCKETP
jgi:hypothetical protein